MFGAHSLGVLAMHRNTALIEKLFTSLDNHNHQSMADCYHPEAKFKDIAFDLTGKKKIHAMWHLICDGDIRVKVEAIDADGIKGISKIVDEYTFTDTGNTVINKITSAFSFKDGLIFQQEDNCDAKDWASQALGGIKGYLAGRIQFLRKLKAFLKLREFIRSHPQYR